MEADFCVKALEEALFPGNVEVVFIGKASALAQLSVTKSYVRRSRGQFMRTVPHRA